MSTDQIVLTSVDSELSPAMFYDHEVRYLFDPQERKRAASFSVTKIISDFSRDNASVMKITLPMTVYHNNAEQTDWPGFWETRDVCDLYSWSVITGTATGDRMEGRSILQNRYQNLAEDFRPIGRRVLVHAPKGSLVAMGQIQRQTETYLVYQVEDVLDWPSFHNYRPRPEHPVAAANLRLVAVFVKKHLGASQYWYSDTLDAEAILSTHKMRDAVAESMHEATTSFRYIKHFRSAPHRNSRNVSYSVPVDQDVLTRMVDADEFMLEIHMAVSAYRRALYTAGVKEKSAMIPCNAQYEILEDVEEATFKIKMTLEIPSILPNYQHFAIETVFIDTLPEKFVNETSLTYMTSDFFEFASQITHDGGTKNLLTFI